MQHHQLRLEWNIIKSSYILLLALICRIVWTCPLGKHSLFKLWNLALKFGEATQELVHGFVNYTYLFFILICRLRLFVINRLAVQVSHNPPIILIVVTFSLALYPCIEWTLNWQLAYRVLLPVNDSTLAEKRRVDIIFVLHYQRWGIIVSLLLSVSWIIYP